MFGSYLHKYDYPDFYKAHQDNGRELKTWRRGKPFVKGLKGGESDSAEYIRDYDEFLRLTAP